LDHQLLPSWPRALPEANYLVFTPWLRNNLDETCIWWSSVKLIREWGSESLLNRCQNLVHAQDSPSSEDSSAHIHMHALPKPATDLKQKVLPSILILLRTLTKEMAMRIVVQDLSTKMNWLCNSSLDKCHLAHIKRAYFHTCHAAFYNLGDFGMPARDNGVVFAFTL
jgi:hypothetical protein